MEFSWRIRNATKLIYTIKVETIEYNSHTLFIYPSSHKAPLDGPCVRSRCLTKNLADRKTSWRQLIQPCDEKFEDRCLVYPPLYTPCGGPLYMPCGGNTVWDTHPTIGNLITFHNHPDDNRGSRRATIGNLIAFHNLP